MVTIEYRDGTKEKIHRFDLTPTGLQMRNTSKDELRKVLEGDGRNLIVYGKDKTRIIRTYEIRDIILHGESVLIPDVKSHRCGVWCDVC